MDWKAFLKPYRRKITAFLIAIVARQVFLLMAWRGILSGSGFFGRALFYFDTIPLNVITAIFEYISGIYIREASPFAANAIRVIVLIATVLWWSIFMYLLLSFYDKLKSRK